MSISLDRPGGFRLFDAVYASWSGRGGIGVSKPELTTPPQILRFGSLAGLGTCASYPNIEGHVAVQTVREDVRERTDVLSLIITI
jgi:hypothetical protein